MMRLTSCERTRLAAMKAERDKLIKERVFDPPPPVARCLICKKPMPLTWHRLSPEDDPVCASCDAMPIRPHTGWGGYASCCEDVSGGSSGWDMIVRLMEDREE